MLTSCRLPVVALSLVFVLAAAGCSAGDERVGTRERTVANCDEVIRLDRAFSHSELSQKEQKTLAVAYDRGNCVPSNHKRAFGLYSRLMEQGFF